MEVRKWLERSQIAGENQADRSPSWAVWSAERPQKCLLEFPKVTTTDPPAKGREDENGGP